MLLPFLVRLKLFNLRLQLPLEEKMKQGMIKDYIRKRIEILTSQWDITHALLTLHSHPNKNGLVVVSIMIGYTTYKRSLVILPHIEKLKEICDTIGTSSILGTFDATTSLFAESNLCTILYLLFHSRIFSINCVHILCFTKLVLRLYSSKIS